MMMRSIWTYDPYTCAFINLHLNDSKELFLVFVYQGWFESNQRAHPRKERKKEDLYVYEWDTIFFIISVRTERQGTYLNATLFSTKWEDLRQPCPWAKPRAFYSLGLLALPTAISTQTTGQQSNRMGGRPVVGLAPLTTQLLRSSKL